MPPFGKSLAKSAIDAGMGLIYRLNTLFNKAEDAGMTGDFERWNYILDRIYINLTYKDAMEIEYEYDNDGNKIGVKNVKQPNEEVLVYDYFTHALKLVRSNMFNAIKKKDKSALNKAKEDHYALLKKKDIWLRKVMMERGLYLKESEFDPTKALWGG